MLTSKGASGVTGASFIALVGTLSVVPTIPVAAWRSFGVDRFMSEVRALVNMIGNGMAAVVMTKWEGELDEARLKAALAGAPLPEDEAQDVAQDLRTTSIGKCGLTSVGAVRNPA